MTDLQEYKLNGERNRNDRYDKMVLVRSMELTEMTTAQLAVLWQKLKANDNGFLGGAHITYKGLTVTGWNSYQTQYYLGTLPYNNKTKAQPYIMLHELGRLFYNRGTDNNVFLDALANIDEDETDAINANYITKLDFLIKNRDGNIATLPSRVEETTDADGAECYRVTADIFWNSALWRCSWDAYEDGDGDITSWKTHSKEEIKTVTSVGGNTGDVALKTINGNEITGEGNIEVEGIKTYVLDKMTQDERKELGTQVNNDHSLMQKLRIYWKEGAQITSYYFTNNSTKDINCTGIYNTTFSSISNSFPFAGYWEGTTGNISFGQKELNADYLPKYMTVNDDGSISKVSLKLTVWQYMTLIFQNKANTWRERITMYWNPQSNYYRVRLHPVIDGEMYDGEWDYFYLNDSWTVITWKKHTGGVNTVNGESGDVTLKTINGEALTGEGDITVKTDGDIVTIRYGQDPRNVEAYNLLYNYKTSSDAVTVNFYYSPYTYDATNITAIGDSIKFDAFFTSNLGSRQLSYSSFTLSEDGNCTMDFNRSCHVPTLMGEDTADIRLKYINGQSLIGDGDIIISGGGGGSDLTLKTLNGQSLIGEGNVEIQAGEVFSVNGHKGDVTIDLPTVPKKVSAFTNDANYMSSADASKIVILTESEYEALETKDEKTIYFTTEDK